MSLLAAKTTTSTVEVATTKLSLATMQAQQWSQPELSIGKQHASMDRLGFYKCWSIKEESPAHIVWKKVSKPIITLLEDQFEHLDAKDNELIVEMFMIGRKPARCSPTILFSCVSKTPRSRAMGLVHKKGILTAHPGVRMAECSRFPLPLATEELPGLESSPGVYLYGTSGYGGLSVLILGKDGGPPRKATIGGIVCVDDQFYGLTARHPFSKKVTNEPVEKELDMAFDFFGSDDSEADNMSFSVDFTSQGKTIPYECSNRDISSTSKEAFLPNQTSHQKVMVCFINKKVALSFAQKSFWVRKNSRTSLQRAQVRLLALLFCNSA
jgi:hypothetical protein